MSINNQAVTIVGLTSTGVEVPLRVDSSGQLSINLVSGTSGALKAEDAAAISGDMGIPAYGVRAPGTPVAPTSTAGDWSWLIADDEGKLIVSGGYANPTQTKRSRTDLAAVTDLQLLASAGATLRNYITDVTVENTGAAAARFLLRDNTTTVWSCTVPAGSTLQFSFETPIRPAAVNTVWNGQLGAAGTVTVMLGGYAAI
ncbi:hypothetical protein SEA_ZHENGYI_37 [Microbacterium phage Zhengyi]|nr:hypothetical protein SEA_ZHENGYI_37 [Microbacterium phage Zhengyi]